MTRKPQWPMFFPSFSTKRYLSEEMDPTFSRYEGILKLSPACRVNAGEETANGLVHHSGLDRAFCVNRFHGHFGAPPQMIFLDVALSDQTFLVVGAVIATALACFLLLWLPH